VGGRGAACPIAGRRFAFSDFAAAMAWAQSGRGMGKTILEIA
jgi:NADPH:quinone reductase